MTRSCMPVVLPIEIPKRRFWSVFDDAVVVEPVVLSEWVFRNIFTSMTKCGEINLGLGKSASVSHMTIT